MPAELHTPGLRHFKAVEDVRHLPEVRQKKFDRLVPCHIVPVALGGIGMRTGPVAFAFFGVGFIIMARCEFIKRFSDVKADFAAGRAPDIPVGSVIAGI